LRIRHAILMVFAIAAWGCGDGTFQPLPGWEGDIGKARKEALATGRPLAILYTASWSGRAASYGRKNLSTGAVESELRRFVKVNVDLDKLRSDENKYDVRWVPALVLVSPLGEVKKLDLGNYPADYLAAELKQLKPWKELEGWSHNAAAAEKQARESGKPLAVLYSSAWIETAREYEAEGLKEAHDELAKRFTLLRLNFDAEKVRARDAGVKKVEQLPALVLHSKGGDKDDNILIAGQHEGPLLKSFLKKLGSYQAEVKGWSNQLDKLREVQNRATGQPVAVLLDKADDWSSHHFLNYTLASDHVRERLQAFVKIRLRFEPEMAFLKEMKLNVREREVPCLLVFDKNGAYYQKRMHNSTEDSIVNLLRSVGGRLQTRSPGTEGK